MPVHPRMPNRHTLGPYRVLEKKPIKQNLTFEQKVQVIDFYWQYWGYLTLDQMATALRELGFRTICATTIGRCVKDEPRIRQYLDKDPTNRLTAKREIVVSLPEVEGVLAEWVQQKLNNHRRLRGDIIIEKAQRICELLHIPPSKRLQFSDGWLRGFKRRHGLHHVTFHGERSSVPLELVEVERRRLLPILEQFAPCDRFNVDETALLYRNTPQSGLATYESGGVKGDKTRLTYVFCTNQDGSFKLPPLVIGHAKHPLCFPRGRPPRALGFWYFNNATAWMNGKIWNEFLAYLNEIMRRANRRILLLCDNARSHQHDPANYPNLHIEFLAPNLTSWLQPLDAGIIRSFKAQYRKLFAKLAIRRDDAGYANIYKIDQREAMQLAAQAWSQVSPETISNCWRHTGIVSRDPYEQPELVPRYVADSQSQPAEATDALIAELNLDPNFIHPSVYDTLDALGNELPTEEEQALEDIIQQMHLDRFE